MPVPRWRRRVKKVYGVPVRHSAPRARGMHVSETGRMRGFMKWTSTFLILSLSVLLVLV